MAQNFAIVMHEKDENLHVRLVGDFDGSSASQLIEVLKHRAHAVQRVIIHTGGLCEIHPFGQGVFEKGSSILGEKLRRVSFTGDKADLISPDQSLCV